jgi:hypothetical protein
VTSSDLSFYKVTLPAVLNVDSRGWGKAERSVRKLL